MKKEDLFSEHQITGIMSGISLPREQKNEVREKAQEFACEMDQVKSPTGSPRAIASGCVYLAGKVTGNKITQKQISDSTGFSTVTVRNRHKSVVEELPQNQN